MTISISQTRAPVAADAGYACARVGIVARNNPNDLAAKAQAAGFVSQGNNEYVHADGSWVKMEATGIVNRGVGGVQFQGIPGGRNVPAAQPAPAATYASGGTAQIDRSRPGVPPSMIGYGIARIGIVSGSTAANACAQAGFVQSGSAWIHADGSWLQVSGGSVAVGWKGYALQELPYRNGQGWT